LRPQQTIRQPVELSGRGLFTGEPVKVRFKPAGANTGIVFVRTDQDGPTRIAARLENLTKRARRTSLRNGMVAVETVEHCLSACAALGIDNVEIELDAPELPGFDGSCEPYVHKLQEAGIQPTQTPARALVIPEPVRVCEGDAEVLALPPLAGHEDKLEVYYELEYETASIGRQMLTVQVNAEQFARELAPARTFVLKEEAEQFQAQGLGRHLTPRDILVFGEDGPIENELRFPDECVRHKIVDVIGDLALLGRPLVGRVYARKSGHALNHGLLRRLLEIMEAQELAGRLTSEPELDIRRIQRILPHRYPFLLIDRVIELDGTRRAVAIKNVTINEEFFQGHYPGQPIMPGVLIIEAMAQLGGVLMSQELEHKGKVAVLLSMDNVKFRRPVMPGDQLILEAESIRIKSRTGHCKCRARVGDSVAAEAEIKFMMVDADPI